MAGETRGREGVERWVGCAHRARAILLAVRYEARVCRNFSTTLLFISAGGADERDELCPSMYSFHSSLEEKNQLLHTLTTYGIETTVDRSKKKDRIREWIQSSAISEENEGDESDMCEDSEFYEDEDRYIDGNESEEAEPVSMRGRHFPERRPSAATSDRRKRNTGRVASTPSKSRVPMKPVGRKIPFVPQVAEERETIARFASFPNGDPNLATARNGNDQTHDGTTTSPSTPSDAPSTTNHPFANNIQASEPSTNGRSAKDDPARDNAKSPHADKSPVATSTASPTKQSPPKVTNSPGKDNGAKILPTSPQIPARKNRAHTAPFSDATTTRAVENRAKSTRRAQSATVLRTMEADESSSSSTLPPRATPTKTPVASPHPLTRRSENHAVAVVASNSRTARSTLPTRAAVAAPMISPIETPQPPSNNSALPARVEGSPPMAVQQIAASANALSMSTASHLVMQSFNALQGIANVGSGVAPSPTSLPTNPPANMNMPSQWVNKEVAVSYGKDPYAHYGIAHGAILPMRVGVVRQDSTGSGSRSVSN